MEVDPEQPAPAASGAVELGKKADQYLKDTKLPNMHVAVHYTATAEEYGLTVNCNGLLGEDKHRGFKKWIYSTNHRHPEKDLLSKENLRQTLRLVLANGFREDEVATQLVKDVYRMCPALFGTVLPRSEQMSLEADAADDDEDELEGLVGDDTHQHPTAIGCVQPKYVQTTLRLPTRASQLFAHPLFGKGLSIAYGRDYGKPRIVMFTGTFAWCKKLSFFDPTSQRRCTFKMGDFVRQVDNTVIRVDQIFIHTFEKERRLFIRGTVLAADDSAGDDLVLGNGYRRALVAGTGTPTTIIGLPSISPDYLYVVPIETDADGSISMARQAPEATEFIWSQYTVHWL